MARTHEIETGWEHPETEEPFRVTIKVTAGSPGRLHGEPGDCYPAEAPDFDVVKVVEDFPGGAERPDLIAAVEAELSGRWGDEVADSADEDARDRYADAMERRYDAIREERMLGGRS